ncbi:MAG TPA: Isoquinoline 1-oxidoreductase subunit [Casimicrobiaceae bacterium]|nr:Isoquinoline 1-oxidoreductase subunit [Casimicrobiaceae bacterium]
MRANIPLQFSVLIAAFAIAIPTSTAQSQSTASLKPAASFASIADSRERALALFAEAGKVIQHPRCVNCHPRADRPLQGDAMRVHIPPVTRGKDGHGGVAMECKSCHAAKNFDATPMLAVPGHERWHLAPIEMAWEGRSLGEICVQIKDRARNGNKSLAEIVEHMASDSLVGWGWNPGNGRTAAPGTQREFGEIIKAWASAGAHCPA